MHDQPDEDDAFITDKPMGGYAVSVEGKTLGVFYELDEAEARILRWMDAAKVYPDVWYVDDHGGVELHTFPDAS